MFTLKYRTVYLPLFLLLLFLAACQPAEPVEVTVVQEVEVTREVNSEVEVTREVEVMVEVMDGDSAESMSSDHAPSGVLRSIINAPIVADGTLTGAFPDFVINFDADMHPAVPGRMLREGDQIRIVMPDDFVVEGEPTPQDPFDSSIPFGENSWAALLQGWPQVPIFSSFPPGNLEGDIRYTISMEGTHTMVITADQDLDGTLSFTPPSPDGPGIKQIHALFAHLRNPEPGFYPIEVISQTGPDGAEERGVAYMEVLPEEQPAIAFTSWFNGNGRPNAIYQTTQVGQRTPIPFHLLVWGNDGEPLSDAEAYLTDGNTGVIAVGDDTSYGTVSIDAPHGASGYELFSLNSAEEVNAPISGLPTSHLTVHFSAGDKPGLYTLNFNMTDGNSVQAFVNVEPLTESPGARTWPSTVYNPLEDEMILLGGRVMGCRCMGYHDLWTFDVVQNRWRLGNDLKADFGNLAFDNGIFDYDSESNLFVTFGTSQSGSMTPIHLDGNGQVVASGDSDNAPRMRVEPLFIYHPALDRIVVFGGQRGDFQSTYDEMWLYDTNADSWEQIEATGEIPARWRSARAYDSDANRILVYGGSQGPVFGPDHTEQFDTWEFDAENVTWSQIETEVSPELLAQVTGAYDSQSQRFIIFGAAAEGGHETWAFDYATQTWTNMQPAAGPQVNHPGDAVYSPALDRILIYGGNINWPMSPLNSGDFWAYDYESNQWEVLVDGDWQVMEPAEEE